MRPYLPPPFLFFQSPAVSRLAPASSRPSALRSAWLVASFVFALLGGPGGASCAWAQATPTPNVGTTFVNPPNSINAGSSLTLTVNVTNQGSHNNTALNVTRTVTGLPTGMTGVTIGGAGAANATYNSGAGSVTFSGGPYSLGKNDDNLDYTITFTVPCGLTLFTPFSTVNCTSDTQASNNTDSQAITVTSPAQPTNFAGSLTPCQGASQTYSVASAPTGVTYTWTLSGSGTGVALSGASPVTGNSATVNVSAAASGTTVLTVTPTRGSCSGPVLTRNIVPTTTPARPGTISGPATLTTSSTGNGYSIAAVAGATGYTWSVPASVGTVTAGTGTTNITVTAAAAAGSGTISVTANNGSCASPARTLAVTVENPDPQVDVVLAAGTPVRLSATQFDVPFTVRVGASFGDARRLQVNHYLVLAGGGSSAFQGASSVTISSDPSVTGGLTASAINPNFNGRSDTRLLKGSNGTSTMAVGTTATITYTVRVTYPSAAAVPTVAQTTQVFASTLGSGTNAGYTFNASGAPTAPASAIDAEASTNATTLPSPAKSDVASLTPVLFSNPLTANDAFNTRNNTTLAASAATSLLTNDATVGANTFNAATVDLDPDTPALDQTNVTALTGGGLFSVNASGQLSYTPVNAAFTGIATIQYTVRDNAGNLSTIADVSVNVGPSVTNDASTIVYNAALASANVTANDTDIHGRNVTTVQLINPVDGARVSSVTLTGMGTFSVTNTSDLVRFVPSGTFTGTASVGYNFYDNLAGNAALSATGTYTVTLTNTVPVATANLINVAVPASTTTAVVLNPNLSGTDAEGNSTIASFVVNAATSGTLYYAGTPVTAATTVPAGQLSQLTYLPNPAFVGNATFLFAVTDNVGATSASTAYTIPVTAAADVTTTLAGPATTAPSAATGPYTATFTNNGPSPAATVTRRVTLPPGATLTSAQLTAIQTAYPGTTYNTTTRVLDFSSVATLTSGVSTAFSFTFTAPATAILSTPLTSAVTTSTNQGPDTAPNSATLNLRVSSAPVAQNVTNAPTMTSQAVRTNLLALLATDDGAITSYSILTVPPASQGALYVNGTYLDPSNFTARTITPLEATQLSFDPLGTAYGNFTFTYSALDAEGLVSNTATYTIPVTNVGPTAGNDQNDVPFNTPTTGNVILNDNDPELAGLTVQTTPVAAPLHGTLTMTADGSYTYAPTTGYLGPDQFTYRVCDNATVCATATVFIRVYNPATACVSGTGTNLLTNPSFTAGNTGFVTNLIYVGAGGNLYPEDTYTVTANIAPFHSAFSGSGPNGAGDNFMAINASPEIKTMYAQTVAVLPNRYYTFSAYFKNLLTSYNLAVPQVGFVINGQSTSGIVTIPEETTGGPANVWTKFSDVWFSGANTTATFEIRNLTIQRSGNDLGIDDVYFGNCNLPPVAIADLYNTPPATPATFSITNNDSDGDGAIVPSTVVLTGSAAATPGSLTDASGNTFVVNVAGNLTFTPAASFRGIATATYTVRDNNSATSNPGLIAVTVQPPATDVVTTITTPTTGSSVPAGEPLTLTVVTSNNGPNTAYSVSQTVELRPGLSTAGLLVNGQAGTLSGSTITFPGGATYSVTSGVVTFPALTSQVVGSAAAATNTITFPAPGAGPLALTASVTHAALDLVPANNTSTVNLLVSPRFDLLTSLSGPTSVVAGNQATFTVRTTNSATSVSAGDNVVQTVQFPTNLVQVFVSNGGTYDETTGLVTFPAINNLAPGQQEVNTVSFDAPTAGFAASATVTPNTLATGDVNPANNTVTGSTAVTTRTTAIASSANAYVTISASATSVAPGAPVTLALVAGNHGSTTAGTVALSVMLPPSLTFTNLGSGSYEPTTGELTFPTVGTPMAAGTSQSYNVTFLAPATGPVFAAAAVNTSVNDVVPSNNYMSTRIEVAPQADLTIALAAPATANAGDPIVYTVTTRNLSGLPARNLDQTVQLAPGLSGVTVSGGGTYNATTGLVTLPTLTLAVSASQSYAITITAPADITALRAVAVVASSIPEINYANNAATAATTLTAAADVTIAVTGPASAIINSPVSFVVTTTNNGPSVALSTTPAVQLPRNLIVINLPSGATYVASTGLLTLPALTNLPSGTSSATAFTVVMPDVARLVPTAIANVTTATNDRNLANNFASASTIATAPTDQLANLAAMVSVTSSGATVTSATPGQSLTYTATFTNNGPNAATAVAPRLALPSGLAAASVVVSNGGVYNATAGLVTWPVSATVLDLNQSYSYTVTLPATATGPLTATAVVSSATSDNLPANNSASTSVTIDPRANVISRVAGPASAQPGETVTYSVTTSNNGSSGAASVQTTVTLPAGVTNVVLPTGATQLGNEVTLPIDAFQMPGVNGQQTYLLTFTPVVGSASWTVTSAVTTATTETDATDNSGTATTTRGNVLPVTTNVVNALPEPVCATADRRAISALVGSDTDGNMIRYTIAALPPASQGVLYANGLELNTTNFPYLRVSPAQSALLEFDPAPGFTGNVFFTYTATDNRGGISQPTLYTLPIGRDTDSYYTLTPVLAGASAYSNGYAIANLFDINGGEYASNGSITDVGARSAVLTPASAPLPAGVGLNPTTGQLFVVNRSLLVPGTYTVVVQTVDQFSGTNPVSVTFQIGDYPLPVELMAFTVKSRGADALLTWATASEKNSAYFLVDRSLDGGRTFTEIGRRTGAGTTLVLQEYALTDAGVGRTAGTVYYRLRQVDFDGTTTPSDVRAVTFAGKALTNVCHVYPNPAATATTVDLTELATGDYTVTLFDATGRRILTATQVGGTQQPLDIQALPTGTYLLRVTGADGFSTAERLVKE